MNDEHERLNTFTARRPSSREGGRRFGEERAASQAARLDQAPGNDPSREASLISISRTAPLVRTSHRVGLLLLLACTCHAHEETEPRIANSFHPSRQRIPVNPHSHTPHPAVVRVSAAESDAIAQGSGTFVAARGDYGLVVTNWHIIRDARGKVVVTFPDSSVSAATVAKVDEHWDLAALLIWRPRVAPVRISRQPPQRGELLTIAGYGSGSFRAATGRCTQYVAPSETSPYEIVELSAVARQGDSGGPILNRHGELAGVLFGSDGSSTTGSYCGRVRLFLESVWPAIDQVDELPAETFVSVPYERTDAIREETRHVPDAPVPPRDQSLSAHGSQAASLPSRAAWRQEDERSNAVDWSELFGKTPLDRAKSILAGIGVLAVLLQLARVVSGGK